MNDEFSLDMIKKKFHDSFNDSTSQNTINDCTLSWFWISQMHISTHHKNT